MQGDKCARHTDPSRQSGARGRKESVHSSSVVLAVTIHHSLSLAGLTNGDKMARAQLKVTVKDKRSGTNRSSRATGPHCRCVLVISLDDSPLANGRCADDGAWTQERML